jgi:HEAT repeat protein
MRSVPGLLVAAPVLASLALVSSPQVRAADPASSGSEKVLKKAGLATDGPSLLAFFRQRILTGNYQERIDELTRRLGDESFKVRKQAAKDLVGLGPPALPALRRAQKSPDTETQSRAETCIEILEKDPGPALPLAALALLRDRNPAGAAPVLLEYLPFADNKEVEEDVQETLLVVGVKDRQADPALTAALGDKRPALRGAAAYVLGRVGDLDQRADVRRLLGDADPGVRKRAGQGLVGKETYALGEGTAAQDEALLKGQKVPADADGLLAFFRKRTLSEADQRHLEQTVRDLGSKTFRVRQKATAELVGRGSASLPFLRPALKDADVEVRSRARECITKIESGPGKALPAAAARVLARRLPPQAVATLLAFVPFADDEVVEEEVLSALSLLSVRQVALDPALKAALADRSPARRAAAALVIGRVGSRADCRPVARLVADPDAKVRFQAAQVLLAGRDKSAVPTLVALVGEGPIDLARQADEVLAAIAGGPLSKDELGEDPAKRRKAQGAWRAWWQANEARIDLARVEPDTPTARALRARKITEQCLGALLHADKGGFLKTLKYPFYMEGFNPNGKNQADSARDLERFLTVFEMAEFKAELKKMSFKFNRVVPLNEYLKVAQDREKTFLSKLRSTEVLVVFITPVHEGMPDRGDSGAVFVRVVGGRAWVIGFGSPRRDLKAK